MEANDSADGGAPFGGVEMSLAGVGKLTRAIGLAKGTAQSLHDLNGDVGAGDDDDVLRIVCNGLGLASELVCAALGEDCAAELRRLGLGPEELRGAGGIGTARIDAVALLGYCSSVVPVVTSDQVVAPSVTGGAGGANGAGAEGGTEIVSFGRAGRGGPGATALPGRQVVAAAGPGFAGYL